MPYAPRILVLIPTRDRPADIKRCLESLLAVDYPVWETLIVDQSDQDGTEQMVDSYRGRLAGLTYRRVRERGLTRARNIGLRAADGKIIAFLDDDCTVNPDWLKQVAAVFARHPRAVLAFGTVRAAPHDPAQILIPEFIMRGERIGRRPRGTFGLRGMGAGMYVWPLRSAQRRLFDEHLGSGTRWPAADERDYAYRTLLAREEIVETAAIEVQHHGARSLHDGAAGRLYRGYSLANGAMDMKLLRCGNLRMMWYIASEIWANVASLNYLALLTRRGPTHVAALVMYVSGLVASFRLPVDRRHCVYRAWSKPTIPGKGGREGADTVPGP